MGQAAEVYQAVMEHRAFGVNQARIGLVSNTSCHLVWSVRVGGRTGDAPGCVELSLPDFSRPQSGWR